jgi:hypothetical protein
VILPIGAWFLIAVDVVGLIAAAVLYVRKRLRRAKALSYCRRDAQGNIYVQDPQHGTWHRLDNLLVKRAIGEIPDVTPRHRKRVRRQLRQAMRA